MNLDSISEKRVKQTVNNYFESRKNDTGFIEDYLFPVSITGLACELNVCKEQILWIKPNDRHYETITKAKRNIEAFYENQLVTGKSATGIMFVLKTQFGWSERESEKNDLSSACSLDFDEISTEDIIKIANM